MTKSKLCQMERQLERDHANRLRAEDRYLEVREIKYAQCEYLIGSLCNGDHYIITRRGNVKRFASWVDAAEYLIKNNYVTSKRREIPNSQLMR